MSYLSNRIHKNLKDAFSQNNITIEVKIDHVTVKDFHDRKKIHDIVKSAGFFPILSDNIPPCFTVSPYRVPSFFNYFSMNEISKLLKPMLFKERSQENIEDPWALINETRFTVLSALNKGLSEIIFKSLTKGYPILEIGSGKGYSIPEELAQNIIRTQMSDKQCQLLRKSILGPIYQIDINGLCKSLSVTGKKIPLIFALNVFDTMDIPLRENCLLELSKLQNPGDRILSIHDTNPFLNVVINQLEAKYPEHGVFPYVPLKDDPESNNFGRLSFVVLPGEFKPSRSEFESLLRTILLESMDGKVSELQQSIESVRLKYNAIPMNFEDYFIEQIKNNFENTGYKVNIYYHASFTVGKLPPTVTHPITENLIYKATAGSATLRQWALTDANLQIQLKAKGLEFPAYFKDKMFRIGLIENGHKVFGAELLIIEATKL